jgi:hypothetical protein
MDTDSDRRNVYFPILLDGGESMKKVAIIFTIALTGCASTAEQAYIDSVRNAQCEKVAKPGTIEFQGCKEYLARQEFAARLML